LRCLTPSADGSSLAGANCITRPPPSDRRSSAGTRNQIADVDSTDVADLLEDGGTQSLIPLTQSPPECEAASCPGDPAATPVNCPMCSRSYCRQDECVVYHALRCQNAFTVEMCVAPP
jgi:hypothetical protein